MRFEKSISCLDFLEDEAEKETRSLALSIDRRLVNETPFRSGQAKANWLASVDAADDSVVNIDDALSQSTAALMALEQGAAEFNSARNFTRLYIQNNLPYIGRLDAGWSQQQPNPFVDKIIAEEVNR